MTNHKRHLAAKKARKAMPKTLGDIIRDRGMKAIGRKPRTRDTAPYEICGQIKERETVLYTVGTGFQTVTRAFTKVTTYHNGDRYRVERSPKV